MADLRRRAPGAGVREMLTQRPTLAVTVFTVVLGIVAFLVLYPLIVVLLKSFETGEVGVMPSMIGLDNWRAVLSEPRMLDAIRNTFLLGLTRQVIALIVGFALAWVLARTNLPARRWLEFGFWVALFLPTLTVTLGWIILFDGTHGLVNQALVNWMPFIDDAPFEVFSWWGIVFVHLMTGTLAINVMLLTLAFRNIDGALEDASRALGAGTLRTLWRVAAPAMLPAIIVVTLLGAIRSLEAFEIELVLGSLDQIDIYSTVIFKDVHMAPPQYGSATALAMMFLAVLVPFIALQRWMSARRGQTLVSGGYSARVVDIGRWRWPAFSAVAALLLFLTVIPVMLVTLSTFMRAIGDFSVDSSLTLRTWTDSLGDADVRGALRNSLVLGFGSSALAMTGFTALAYITVHTQFYGRHALAFLTWLPSTLPGIILSLGLLWLFLQVGVLRDHLLGSVWALMIPVALRWHHPRGSDHQGQHGEARYGD